MVEPVSKVVVAAAAVQVAAAVSPGQEFLQQLGPYAWPGFWGFWGAVVGIGLVKHDPPLTVRGGVGWALGAVVLAAAGTRAALAIFSIESKDVATTVAVGIGMAAPLIAQWGVQDAWAWFRKKFMSAT